MTVAEVDLDVASNQSRLARSARIGSDGRAVEGGIESGKIAGIDAELVKLGAFVAELDLGANDAEIIAGDQVDVVAALVVELERILEDVAVLVLGKQDAAFDADVGRAVAGDCRRGDCRRSDGREQIFAHARSFFLVWGCRRNHTIGGKFPRCSN